MLTIYHNPRCSKSREALALVEEFAAAHALSVEVIEYLKMPPSLNRLQELQALLACAAQDMVRANEDEYAQLELGGADEATLLRAVASHPKLLQRPIVVAGDGAVIARPPELLHDFLRQRFTLPSTKA